MKNRVTSLFLAFCIIVGLFVAMPVSVGAYSGTKYGDYLYYTVYNNNVEITDCDESAVNIIIPSKIGGKPVTSIGDYAFYGCGGLTSVSIPSGVTSIGYGAFYSCGGLTNVNIPSSVTSIGERAFEDCIGLTSVNIPSGVTRIGAGAFSDCGLTSVSIPNGVTSIGDYVFLRCRGLTSVSIPSSVTSIGESAFSYCGLTSVNIPSSVTSIGAGAFSDCGLTSVSIPSSVTSIGDYTFYNCNGLTSVSISGSVTSIGVNAFRGCYKFTDISYGGTKSGWGRITIGEGNDSIVNADKQCSDGVIQNIASSGECGLNVKYTLTQSGKLTLGGYGAVTTAPWLSSGYPVKRVTIPSGITFFCGNAFSGCNQLLGVYISNLSDWYELEFENPTANPLYYAHNLYVKNSIVTSVSIPSSVKKINNYLFYNCSELTSVSISSGVTIIGDSAFEGCSGLTSVSIPNSVTSIGVSAFEGCSGLISVSIPSSVTRIRDYTFLDCSGLTSVSISNGVTSIGYKAFNGCGGLTSVSIPNSVTSIDYEAFSYCSKLKDVYYLGTALQWAQVDGGDMDSAAIHCSDGICAGKGYCGASYYDRLYWALLKTGRLIIGGSGDMDSWNKPEDTPWYKYRRDITAVEVQDGVRKIGDYAFQGFTLLKEITLPESVTSVGAYAFDGCVRLNKATIPQSVTSIGENAFRDCGMLSDIYYGGFESDWDGAGTPESVTIHYAEWKNSVSKSGYNNEIRFEILPNENKTPKGSTVILALYTASNRLIGFEEAKFNGGKISFYTDKQYAHYKVMAWDALDGNLQPTCGVSRGESIEFD